MEEARQHSALAITALLALAMTGLARADEAIAVPSGQSVTWHDVIREAAVWRFRFVAPDIAVTRGITFDLASDDMQHLCDAWALPRIAETGPRPGQVVIVLMERPVPFGEAAPGSVQFFETYRPEGDRCQWEAF